MCSSGFFDIAAAAFARHRGHVHGFLLLEGFAVGRPVDMVASVRPIRTNISNEDFIAFMLTPEKLVV
jgi:hypothetical protein